MKILLCHKFLYYLGGAERYVLDLRRSLSQGGHTVIDFFTQDIRNQPSFYSQHFVPGTNFSALSLREPLKLLRSSCDFIYSFRARDNISELIKKHKPDVAHIHNIYHHLSASILPVLRKAGIPTVMTVHDYKLICPAYSLFSKGSPCQKCKGARFYRAFINKCLKDSYPASLLASVEAYFTQAGGLYRNNIDLFITPSDFAKRKMVEFGFDEKKIRHLPCAVDLNGFGPAPKDGGYVLYIGSLGQKKGVDVLLRAAADLGGLALKIAGEGEERRGLQELCRKNALADVEFLGYLERDRLIDCIRQSLFVVVPSSWPEVAGLVIYEAFACGKAVVASDAGGIPEVVQDNINGLLFHRQDAADLAAKMRILLDDPAKAEKLGRAGLEGLKSINDQKKHIGSLLKIYSEAQG